VTYTVRWKRSALNRLAELWLKATDRVEIDAAVSDIDRLLAARPDEVGESRSDLIRVFFSPPLGVFYEVAESQRIVNVLRVWSF
jgi:hypothetical protein